jgi:cellulose synthase/poly-beta-1,6-N-acetylglucosamine synthase-like glycosyltransferase
MVFILASAFGIILYTLLGYPVILFLLSKAKGKPSYVNKEMVKDWPEVTLVIAAYNEEESIREKLENCLCLDYPREKLEIVVVSDHSSDRTDDIVRSFAGQGIRLHRMPRRGGKLAGHRSVLKEIKSDIVLFSDATTIYHKNVIKELVKHCSRKEIGCVGGAITYKELDRQGSRVHPVRNSSTLPSEGSDGALNSVSTSKGSLFSNGVKEQKYFSYEVMVRKLENQVDSVPVVSGAIYAIRKELYADIPDHLADDLINPLHVRKLGYLTLFEPNAQCWEVTPRNLKGEYLKRKRIAAQNVAGLFHMRGLLNPFKYPVFSWILFSHKVLRLILPFLYVVIAITGLLFVEKWINLTSIALIIGVMVCVYLVVRYLGISKKIINLLSLPMYFVIFHIGIILGIIESFLGKKYATWQSE